MKKRIISMLLAIFTVVGMLPAVAFAADTVASGTCGDGVSWTLDSDGVLTVSGSGAMENYNSATKQPWKDYRSTITTVVIGDKITAIGEYAFYKCEMSTVTIPSSVTTIEAEAFRSCTKLTAVTIPNSVVTIGQSAFNGCTGLTTVTIPSSVTSIGKTAFKGCSNLSEFNYLGTTAPTVGDNVFQNCNNLTTIYVPENYSADTFPGFSGSLKKELPSGSEEEPITTCTINVSANPDKGGTVTGAGEYEKGATVTVTATANEGYTFVSWTENGTEVSTAATYSFTAAATSSLVANFEGIPIASVTIGTATTEYSSLAEAFNAADGKTATITLLQDWDNSANAAHPTLTSNDSRVTLDLNGKKIFNDDNPNESNTLDFAGECIIKNGEIEFTGGGQDIGFYSAVKNAKLTINGDVKISNTNRYGKCISVIYGNTVIIEDGAEITVPEKDEIEKTGAIRVYANSTLIVNGGTITSNGEADTDIASTGENTTVVVNGGNFDTVNAANVYFNIDHTATVTGNAWYKLTNAIDASVATVAYTENTTVYDGTTYGLAGSDVTLTATPASGVTVSKLLANNTEATAAESGYSFSMPYTTVVITAADSAAKPVYVAYYSLSLKGNIGVNYYMHIDDAVAADPNGYMQFTTPRGGTVKIPIGEAEQKTVNGENYYVFTATVAAKEMMDTIQGQYFYGETSSEVYEYTVKQYADIIIANKQNDATYDAFKPVAEAMLVYGAWAQKNFGYNTDNLPVEVSEITEVTAENLSSFAITETQGTANAPLASVSLVLRTETSMRLYFDTTAELTATMNGKSLNVVKKGSQTYVEIPNISAKNLDDTFTVTINDGTEEATVSYSPMTYCYNVLIADGISDDMKNTAKALYLYNQAANTYFQ